MALAAGYTHWLALTARGRVFSCATGDDGYAGALARAEVAPRAGGPGPPGGEGGGFPGRADTGLHTGVWGVLAGVGGGPQGVAGGGLPGALGAQGELGRPTGGGDARALAPGALPEV